MKFRLATTKREWAESIRVDGIKILKIEGRKLPYHVNAHGLCQSYKTLDAAVDAMKAKMAQTR